MLLENTLKALYHAGEHKGDFAGGFSVHDIAQIRSMEPVVLNQSLQKLRRKYLVRKTEDRYYFTEEGLERGKKVVKLHRLWEMYLSKYLNLPADHIHDDAETMEHIITPQIEQWLEEQLEFPATDPHGEQIPY
jgi:manganese/zinc/iron transport system permease protein